MVMRSELRTISFGIENFVRNKERWLWYFTGSYFYSGNIYYDDY